MYEGGNMEIGQRVGRFTVVELLKEHKHSITGICLHLELKTKWFIKFIPIEYEDTSEELSNLLLLDYGSVPKVIDVYKLPEGRYYILEYIQGMTLDEYMTQYKLPFKSYIDIMLSLTQTLEHLHCYGVVHGDLKDENILIGPQKNVYLIDFGSSFKDRDSKSFTFEMVAPERLTDTFPPDERSDLYALGLIFKTMLDDYLKTHKYKSFMTLIQAKKLKRLIGKCTMVNPNQRIQSAVWVKDALLLIK